MTRVLILTGTCGSGKTTISKLLAEELGWERIVEDDIWHNRFGKNRGAFLTNEHRRKRRQVHDKVFSSIMSGLASGRNIVVDVTVHETPPEAFEEYRSFLNSVGVDWSLKVLHPRLEVAVARDANRRCWSVGADAVRSLHVKFTGMVFGHGCYIDNSDETPHETMGRLMSEVAA